MSELQGQAGEVRMTVSITRKATGKVETVELVGRVDHMEYEETKEQNDGGDALDSGT